MNVSANEKILQFLERIEKELSRNQKLALATYRKALEAEKTGNKVLDAIKGEMPRKSKVLATTGRETSQRIIAFSGPRPTGKDPS